MAEQPIRLILINLGTNDLNAWPLDQATFQNNYLAILDTLHALYPLARMYLSRVWRRNDDAHCAIVNGWIDNVIAARSFAASGDDETTWLKGTDDGATMTYDGVHYNATGEANKVTTMLAIPIPQ